MFLITQKMLSSYKKKDVVKGILDKYKDGYCSFCSSHKAHVKSVEKRLVYYKMYGDFLEKGRRHLSILDVGGGYHAMSEILGKNRSYTILDNSETDPYTANEWHAYTYKLTPNKDYWDIIIANDLFPNVDQRLDLFLEKFLPYCKEMRLSLTYFYDNPKWYFAKRLDGDETLCLSSWTKEQLSQILKKYKKNIRNMNLRLLFERNESIFENGRQVCILKLKGGKDEQDRQMARIF